VGVPTRRTIPRPAQTYANKNSTTSLTDHDPWTGNPETHPSLHHPWRYVFRHAAGGPARCSGREVEDNFPTPCSQNVPDDKLYDSGAGAEGEHSWTDNASQLDVSGMDTPGCSDKRALRNFNRVFPADSVTKTLSWTLRRLGGPGGP
jgi:hypothetical protein